MSPITTLPGADRQELEAHIRLTQMALSGVDGDAARALDVGAATVPADYTREDLARGWTAAALELARTRDALAEARSRLHFGHSGEIGRCLRFPCRSYAAEAFTDPQRLAAAVQNGAWEPVVVDEDGPR